MKNLSKKDKYIAFYFRIRKVAFKKKKEYDNFKINKVCPDASRGFLLSVIYGENRKLVILQTDGERGGIDG